MSNKTSPPSAWVYVIPLNKHNSKLLWHPRNGWNFLVFCSLSLVCCETFAFSTILETFSRTLHVSVDVNSSIVRSVLAMSAAMVKLVIGYTPIPVEGNLSHSGNHGQLDMCQLLEDISPPIHLTKLVRTALLASDVIFTVNLFFFFYCFYCF